jgi:hypothetical protein
VLVTSYEVVATMEDLLAQLRGSRTDLARIVEAAARTELPFIVVPAGAVRAWEEREPSAWGKVRDWLTGQGKAIVEREDHPGWCASGPSSRDSPSGPTVGIG